MACLFVRKDCDLSDLGTASANAAGTAAAQRGGVSKAGSPELLDIILNSLEEEKAEDIVSIPLKGKSEMADHMVIASGRSSRQVTSIAEKLVTRLKETLGRRARLEGKVAGDWVLVDCGDAVVHIFRPEVREFYQLEKMWLTQGETAPDPSQSS